MLYAVVDVGRDYSTMVGVYSDEDRANEIRERAIAVTGDDSIQRLAFVVLPVPGVDADPVLPRS